MTTVEPRALAVVAGATGALGQGILAGLRNAGLTVVAVARSGDALKALAADDDGVWPCVADVSTDACVSEVRAALDGPVRMVVQAAGLPAGSPLDTVAPGRFGEAVDLKVGGLLRLVRACDDHLGDGSRVVALGGHYGFEPAVHAPLAGVTNAALANLVRQLADLLGPRGVTAHLVSPGPVDTERMRRVAADAAERRGTSAEAVLDEYRRSSPLGRLTTVDEVAWAVVALLDPRAGAMTGSNLGLDAGRRRSSG